MKRDMDLVRAILFAIEDYSKASMSSMPAIDGYSEEQIAYHIHIMKQDGLLDAESMKTQASMIPVNFSEIRLTWTGHEFIDAALG